MTSRPRSSRHRPLIAAIAAASVLLLAGCTGGDSGGDSGAGEPDGTPRGQLPNTWVADAAEQKPPEDTGGPPTVDLTTEQKCAIPWKPAIGAEKPRLREVLNDEQDDGTVVHKCSFSGKAPVAAGLVRYPTSDVLAKTYADLIGAGASEHVRGDQTVALLRNVYPNDRTEYIVVIPDPEQLASLDLEIESPDSEFDAEAAIDLAMSAFD